MIDLDVPVEIDGVTFRSGDLVIADEDGVVVVPQEVETEAIHNAWAKVHAENVVRDSIKAGCWRRTCSRNTECCDRGNRQAQDPSQSCCQGRVANPSHDLMADSSRQPTLRAGKRSWSAASARRRKQARSTTCLGAGKPILDLDGSVDDDWWWVRSWLKREGLSIAPPTVEIRRTVEQALARLWTLPSEASVRREVLLVNEQIRKAQFAVTFGPDSSLLPLDADEVVGRWRERRGYPDSGQETDS